MSKIRKSLIRELFVTIKPGIFRLNIKKVKEIEVNLVAPGQPWKPNANSTHEALKESCIRNSRLSIFPLAVMVQEPALWLLWLALGAFVLLQLHSSYIRVKRFVGDAVKSQRVKSQPVKSQQKEKQADLSNVLSWESIEMGIQNMSWKELYQQKKFRGKIGDVKIEGKIRNLMQKHWERSVHWKAGYKEILKDYTPQQVLSFYPSPNTEKVSKTMHLSTEVG